MSMLFKPMALSLGFVAMLGGAAQAQTVATSPVVPGQSVADLPPLGPRASSLGNIRGDTQMPITQTGNYPGPAPGAGNGQMPGLYQKPPGYDENVMMHPYQNGLSPRPN
ncbi:MAG: hypothetical protein JO001_24380 [Alphaproteobacteria bacterium]|nr:hypothetical protein [Alphaproteobacteria bacterium]